MTHVAQANQYVQDVLSGKEPACKRVRQACERHVRNLERSLGGDWPYRFDEAKAEGACAFIAKLPHIKGKWARKDPKTGKPQRMKLEPWQCFVVGSIFGWVKKSNGMRRFKFANLFLPRKNGKSQLAAGIGWRMFRKDGEPGAECYFGATSEKQAWEVFGPMRQMGIALPDLATFTGTTINARSLVAVADNAKVEPVIGKPGDGASPHLACVDEYHEHPDSTLFDTMKTGMGAREQPLLLVISTAGENLGGPCHQLWQEMEKLLDGVFEDDTVFTCIWTVDEGDDWTTEAALRKANPNWGVSVNPEIILPDQQAAIRDPGKQGIFKTKHLNLWVGAARTWLNLERWKVCANPDLRIEDFAGHDAWVALDAASKVDMVSLVAVVKRDGKHLMFPRHYLPEETINAPHNRQYRVWRDNGHIVETPGARIDFTVIEEDLKAWSQLLNIQQFGYDPKELNDFVNRVALWASFDRVEIIQSPQNMSEPAKELEAKINAGTIEHTGCPVLTWMASNAILKEARSGGPVKYYFVTKQKSELKIDGVVSAIMAERLAMFAPDASSAGIEFF